LRRRLELKTSLYLVLYDCDTAPTTIKLYRYSDSYNKRGL